MSIRSHITQAMQNYFDSTDRRTRENPMCLEAQLLNMAAVELEDLTLRITRESSLTLQTVPLNIDNGGVYFGGRVPDALLTDPNQTEFNSVIASKDSVQTELSPYVDTLPRPARILVDSDKVVAMPNPIMFTIVGTGDPVSQLYTVQYATPGTLPIPNKMTFWVDEVGLNAFTITLTVVGEVAPQPAWVSERKKTTEVVTINNQGVAYTRNRWAQIDSIAVRGLPVGVRLRGWSMPFNLPAVPDLARPYTSPSDRQILYTRYWQISDDGTLLNEMYMAGGFTGLETIQSQLLTDDMVGIAVEPNTNGMYVCTAAKLYYTDRREHLPGLDATGIAAEPLYGLQVSLDIGRTGPIRYIRLSGLAYANAANVVQYRYVVNQANSLLPSGALGPINTGWRSGPPQPVLFPMTFTGHYEFRLECQDANGILTYDVVPYLNPEFSSLARIDMSLSIDNMIGIAFDSYGKLWVWNGSFAIPVTIHYDGYVLDVDSKTIFTTEPFDSIQVS